MGFEQQGACFSLERYRSANAIVLWSSWPALATMVVGGVLNVGLSPMLDKTWQAVLGITVSAAVVLSGMFTFLRYRRCRAKGRLEMRCTGEILRVVDPVGEALIGECPAGPAFVRPAEFECMGDDSTYITPAFFLDLQQGKRISVGVPEGRFLWKGAAPRITRPDYVMGMRAWDHFSELAGIAGLLVRRKDLAFPSGGRVRDQPCFVAVRSWASGGPPSLAEELFLWSEMGVTTTVLDTAVAA